MTITLCLLLSSLLYQDQTQDVITLNDGKKIVCEIIEQKGDVLRVRRNGAVIEIKVAKIASVEKKVVSETPPPEEVKPPPDETPPPDTSTASPLEELMTKVVSGDKEALDALWKMLGDNPTQKAKEVFDVSQSLPLAAMRVLLLAHSDNRFLDSLWVWCLLEGLPAEFDNTLNSFSVSIEPLRSATICLQALEKCDAERAESLMERLNQAITKLDRNLLLTMRPQFEALILSDKKETRQIGLRLVLDHKVELSTQTYVKLVAVDDIDFRVQVLANILNLRQRLLPRQTMAKLYVQSENDIEKLRLMMIFKIEEKVTTPLSGQLERSLHRALFEDAKSSKDKRIRSWALETLQEQSGNTWPLGSTNWKDYFEE